MFRNLLKPDSALMITMTRITDCIFLSLFWLIGCIPVVTIGASFAALYDSTYRGFRQGEKHCWGRFLEVFRENWKAGILPTGVFLTVLYLLLYPLGVFILPLASVLSGFTALMEAPAALISSLPHISVSLQYPFIPLFLMPAVLSVWVLCIIINGIFRHQIKLIMKPGIIHTYLCFVNL